MANILVVDSYSNSHYLYRVFLNETGHDVFFAQGENEALDTATREIIDVVVIDEVMDKAGDLVTILRLLYPRVHSILASTGMATKMLRACLWDNIIPKSHDFFPRLQEAIVRRLGQGRAAYPGLFREALA